MQKSTLSTLLLQASAACTLAACGGGGGDSNPAPAPTPITLTGKVIANQGVKGATVCLDLNANQQCDAGEPASAATGADGAYSLTTDPAKTTAEQAAAAPFAALLPATAVDAADPGSTVATRAIVLTAPAGKGGQINPLTTLVQTGVASGLARADAEATVAVQMGIAATGIYDYQAQAAPSAPFQDNARLMAQVALDVLNHGQTLDVVGLAASQTASNTLYRLDYTDAANYQVRTYQGADEAGTGKRLTIDKRYGKTGGTATADAKLYPSAYLTPTGWVHCDATPFSGTRGTPSRSATCGGGQQTVGYNVNTDVSGKTMGDVLRQIQADTSASGAANSFNLNASLVDNATFPAGSAVQQRSTVALGQAIYVNDLSSANDYLTGTMNASLETFIQGRQNANVDLSKNSGLLWLGYTGDANHFLAGAFIDTASKVQFYSCTYKANGNFDVCTLLPTQGTFSIVTQGGKRLIKFAGQPSPVDAYNFTVGYAEYSPGVMVRFREIKADKRYLLTASYRLNGTAGDALLKALGL